MGAVNPCVIIGLSFAGSLLGTIVAIWLALHFGERE